MKLMKIFTVALLLGLAFTGKARAQMYAPEAGYRYSVPYSSWDRGFSSYYSYRETGCNYNTCYEVNSNSTVYIEERHVSGGYQRINVFMTQDAPTPYVTYYVHGREVECRRFNHHSRFHDVYYSSSYYHHRSVWSQIDFDRAQGWTNIMAGTTFMAIGGAIGGAGIASGNPVAIGIGAAAFAGGAVSASIGSDQLHRASELEEYVRMSASRRSMEIE